MITEVTATVDLSALRHNFAQVKALAPSSKIIAMVKSNAYGHGLVEVAKTLTEANAFGVARLSEALLLRESYVTQDIVLMPGFLTAEQLPVVSVNNLQIVVHNDKQVQMLEQAELSNPIAVWLKIDTGMGRLGYKPQEAEQSYKRLLACPNVAQVRFMTHFATVDELENPHNQYQLEQLALAMEMYQGEWSAAKSAAVVGFKETYHQWVRPGLMLYGVYPVNDGQTISEPELMPVMTLSAPVIAIRDLKAGDIVGYGGDYVCPHDMKIAVVGVGYGDGYPRHTAQGCPVLIKGKKYPRIGRVCMDMMMVDLQGNEHIREGDTAVLWGKNLPIEDIAKEADTIAYELMCSVTKRVKFEYV